LPVPEKPDGRSYTRSGSGGGRGNYKRGSRSKYGTAEGSPETAAKAKPWEPSATRPRRTTKTTPTETTPPKPAARRKTTAANTSPAENTVSGGSISEETCPLCQKPMVRRKGPYGEFMGCTDYPNCKGTRKF
jgi:hypothetical protein